MWKEILPENCPPNSARELRIKAFRILKDQNPSEDDFKPYARLYDNNPRYKTLCKAYAVSFYDTLQNAKIALQEAIDRGNNLGNYIAQFELIENHGRIEYKARTGHLSTWFYSTWDFRNFNPSFVQPINEN